MNPKTINAAQERAELLAFQRLGAARAARASTPEEAYQVMRLFLNVQSLAHYRKAVTKLGGDAEEALFNLFAQHLNANPPDFAPLKVPDRVRRPRKNAAPFVDPNQMMIFKEDAVPAVSESSPDPVPVAAEAKTPRRKPIRTEAL